MPIQPYHLLSKEYQEKIKYTETIIPELSDVLVCMWEEVYHPEATDNAADIVVPDGCINLIVSVEEKVITCEGISKSEFDMECPVSGKFIGFRFKPGAFWALFRVDTTAVMDTVTPIEKIDNSFDKLSFFELGYEEMKNFLIDYIMQLAGNIKTVEYIQLFDSIHTNHIHTTEELYEFIKLSPRQIQRQFKKHYGLTPQMILSIIKFQHCVTELMYERSDRANLINNYYDQSKFINEFKKNLGITPVQFVNLNIKRKTSF